MLTRFRQNIKAFLVSAMIFACGCAGVQIGSPDPTTDEQVHAEEEWRNPPDWNNEHPKVAPLITKTIVFKDKKSQEEKKD